MRRTGEDAWLGKLYRLMFFAILLLIIILRTPIRKLVNYALLLTAMVALPLIYAILNQSTMGILTDCVQLSKLLYPIALYEVLNYLIYKDKLELSDVDKCVRTYMWFYPISIVIPYILGLGYKSYAAYDAGYSGFYAAGNELSIVLVAMFIFSLNQVVSEREYKMVFATALNVFCILLTGSKTGILMLIVGTVTVMMHSRDLTVKMKRALGIIFVCIPTAYLIIILMSDQITSIINMITFKYRQLGNDFIAFMFSNRTKKIAPNFLNSIYNSENGLINFLIGKGYYHQAVIYKTNANLASSGLIEMDLFDVFFQHGIIITIYVVSFYAKKIFTKCQYQNWIYHFIATTMVIFGLMAGHTFQSTLPSTTLILMMVRMKYLSTKE